MNLQDTKTFTNETLTPETDCLRAMYYIQANPDPGLSARVLGILAKMDLVPDRVFIDREAHADRSLNIELRLFDIELDTAKRIENMFRSIINVQNVIMVTETKKLAKIHNT